MPTYNGHCHCGEIEFTVKMDEPSHILCHCDACKVLSGGESTLNAIVKKDDLKITKGNLKTYTYQGDSGKPVHCYFCPTCTATPYLHQTVMGDDLVVRTILLDGGKEFKPSMEIYGKERLPWQPEVAKTESGGG